MSISFPELDQLNVHVDERTRRRHLTVIRTAVRLRRGGSASRRLLVAVAVLLLTLPVIALASETAVPGDLLYPVKRLVEPVVSIFDGDVVATHRIDETESLFDDRAPADRVSESYSDASDAVERAPHLADRLDEVRTEIDRDPEYRLPGRGAPSTDEPEADDRADTDNNTTTTTTRTETSTTRPTDETTSSTGGDRGDG